MQAFSRWGVDFTVQMPAPRCMASFSPPIKVGQGRLMMLIFSLELSA